MNRERIGEVGRVAVDIDDGQVVITVRDEHVELVERCDEDEADELGGMLKEAAAKLFCIRTGPRV